MDTNEGKDARRASLLHAELGSNQNNCGACDHKKHPDGGWCYMWRDEPKQVCGLHTMKAQATRKSKLLGDAMQGLVEGGVPLCTALATVLKAYDH